MALSNMLREPRRELIEQAIGLVAFAIGGAIVAYPVSFVVSTVAHGIAHGDAPNGGDWFFAAILTAVFFLALIFLLTVVAALIHAVGEAICNAMARRGYDPRPTQRYY